MGVDRRLIQNFEWPALGLVLVLAGIGIVNLVSAAPNAEQGGIPSTVWRQLIWLLAGCVAVAVVLIPDYRRLERVAVAFYLLCLGLLAAVLVVAPVVHGSQRWLTVGPVHLQPSELTKLAMILICARWLVRRGTSEQMELRELLVPASLLAIPCALVLRQPDLGTALLIALIAGSIVLVSRIRLAALGWIGASGLAAASLAWMFYLHDYQKERLLTFVDPDRDPLGAAYHSIQSQIAVGSGGLLGRGYLDGPQSQLDFLPEQQTDFVLSVLAEEWGFVGAGLTLLLYLALLMRGLLIARASKDAFGAYLSIGVVALLFWAGAINVGMVLGVLPVVGVPLPFLSYGGSSLLVSMMGVGLLMNVSMRRYVF